MKKKMKKVISIVLALALTLGMSAAVYADDDSTTTDSDSSTTTATIINNTEYSYTVYQLLIGDVATLSETDSDGNNTSTTYLSNIEAGDNLDVSSIKTDMVSEDPTNYSSAEAITDTEAAQYFADQLELKEDSGSSDGAITEYAYSYVKGGGNSLAAGKNLSVDPGYYLIIKDDSDDRYILEVIGGEYTITEKSNDDVNPEKKILEDSSEVDGTTAAIGDTITFQLTATLPSDFSNYSTYTLTMTDTMSEGLTYLSISSIKIGDTSFSVSETANDDDSNDITYEIKYTESENTTTVGTIRISKVTDDNGSVTGETLLTIEFTNLVGVSGAAANAKVVVVYTAELNENAATGYKANTNTLQLTYSNNPSDSSSTGTSKEDKVYVYTFKLIVDKIDGDEQKALEGAGFTLYEKVESSTAEDGTVTLTVDGVTYTQTTDSDGNTIWLNNEKNEELDPDVFTDGTDYYVAVQADKNEDGEAVYQIYSDEYGSLNFTGLDVGEYVLVETTTPDGYNTADPIYFEISADLGKEETDEDGNTEYDNSEDGSISNISVDNTEDITVDKSGDLSTTVMNYQGNKLPETGGMGTTLIYIIGAALIVGACVALIVSRKKKASRQ